MARAQSAAAHDPASLPALDGKSAPDSAVPPESAAGDPPSEVRRTEPMARVEPISRRLIEPEPMEATMPVDTPRPPVSSLHEPPLLASEALMEELAPVEPARKQARIWCAAMGAGFMGLGALPLAGVRPGGLAAAVPSLVIGGISLVAALSRVTYRKRAVAMVVLGLLSSVVDLRGTGAALAAGVGGLGFCLARLVPAIMLPAALIFRARYRAYAGARVFLGAALVSALPFIVHAALSFGGTFGAGQVGSIIALVAVVASFTGFMGSETQGAGPYLGYSVVVAFAVELGVRALGVQEALTARAAADILAAAVAFGAAAVLASLGLFQIAASRFAADARRIDLHPPPSLPPEEQRDSDVDWSTRA